MFVEIMIPEGSTAGRDVSKFEIGIERKKS